MHPDPMWPVKGEYQCRVCLRKYRVAWEQPESAAAAERIPTAADSITAATARHAIN